MGAPAALMTIPHPGRLKRLLQRRMRRLGLSSHITAAFALTGLFLSTVTALATLGLARQNLLNARESASFSVFVNNSRRVLNELTTETDDEGRRAIIERLSQASGTFPLLLVGEAWTAADPLVFGSESVPASLLQLANTGKPGRIRTRIGDRTALVSALPISRIGVEATYFEAASLDDTEDTLDALATILFGVAAASTMLSAFLGSWASKRLLNPLVEVRTAAESLASGALDTRLEPPGDADLASLTASFNEMARSLEDRIAREARFTSTVSHELRSPLMTLTASAEILTNSADQLDESSRIALELLVDDIARFNRLLEDLLEINRYDIGMTDLQAESVKVMEFIRQTISHYPNIDLSFNAASVTEDTVLWADKRRLRQVMANLVANAVNYGNGEVVVGVERRAGRLLLSVEDDGPGVIPEERDSIFERFARGRAGSSRGRGSGTGLGLSLVAEHVSLHNGRVWAEDRGNGDPGARFVVELPIIADPSEHGDGSLEAFAGEDGYGEDPEDAEMSASLAMSAAVFGSRNRKQRMTARTGQERRR